MDGPDHAASLEPEEFGLMVKLIRETVLALGKSLKIVSEEEQRNRKAARKYLVASRPIKAGENFSEDNLISKRCDKGEISPLRFWDLLNKPSNRSYEIDEAIRDV